MSGDVGSHFIGYVLGDDRPIDWPLLEADGDLLAAGSFRAYCDVRDGPLPDGKLLHRWSTDDGTARIVQKNDVWVVELVVTGSRAWTWERGGFDLFLVDPSGNASPISAGSTWVNTRVYTEIPA